MWTDCHFHVFRGGLGQAGSRYVPENDATLADWRAAAAPCGIRRGVVVQTSFLGTDNGQLLEALTSATAELRGVAVLAPDTPEEMFQSMHRAGVRGVRFNLYGHVHSRAFDKDAWQSATPFWHALERLGWHAEIHTDDGALPDVIGAFPARIPVVLDHFARPLHASAGDPTIQAVRRRAQHAPVHVKLSAAYRIAQLDPGTLGRLWLDELGPAALLWGSDWPCTNHAAHAADYGRLLRTALLDMVPDDATCEAILVDNPERLYWR